MYKSTKLRKLFKNTSNWSCEVRKYETDDEWNARLDSARIHQQILRRKQKEAANYADRLAKDAERKRIERSEESEEETELRQLVDATRHVEMRAEECEDQHQLRKLEQNES